MRVEFDAPNRRIELDRRFLSLAGATVGALAVGDPFAMSYSGRFRAAR
jgi:hypothetical protein